MAQPVTSDDAAPPAASLVVARGAAHGLLVGVPAALINVFLADQDPQPKAALNATLMGLLVGFWVAGFVAGREAPSSPARHGALAGLVVFALVEVIGILGRLDRGRPISPGAIAVLGLVAVALAVNGAGVGARRAARKPSESTSPGGTQ